MLIYTSRFAIHGGSAKTESPFPFGENEVENPTNEHAEGGEDALIDFIHDTDFDLEDLFEVEAFR